MIFCLGTTPAMSRSMTFASLKLDDVNRAAAVGDYAAGKNVNAARVLATLGEPAMTIGFLGGPRAAEMRADMNAAGIVHDFLDVTSPTRLCVTVIDRAAGTATELIEEPSAVTKEGVGRLLKQLADLVARAAGPWSDSKKQNTGEPPVPPNAPPPVVSESFAKSALAVPLDSAPPDFSGLRPTGGPPVPLGAPLSALSSSHPTGGVPVPFGALPSVLPESLDTTGLTAPRSAPFGSLTPGDGTSQPLLLLSGSLAPGVPVTFYRDCVALATSAGVRTIVDAAGEPLGKALAAKPFVVKPNRSELARTLGRSIESDAQLREAIADLISMGPTWAVVTLGRDGAIVSDGREFWRVNVPTIEPVSAIGSGDSFAAGLAAGIARGQTVPEAVRLAAACGVANALTERAGHLSRESVDQFLSQIELVRMR